MILESRKTVLVTALILLVIGIGFSIAKDKPPVTGGDAEAVRRQLASINQVLDTTLKLVEGEQITPKSLEDILRGVWKQFEQAMEQFPKIGNDRFSAWRSELSFVSGRTPSQWPSPTSIAACGTGPS